MITVQAQLKHLRMSPKKVRLVTDFIKGMDVGQALIRLRFTQKVAAQPVAKLLQSAIANARHNNNLEAANLMVKNVIVNQGVALKRWKPAAFGSAHGYKKHSSHITITLGLKPGTEVLEKEKKTKSKTEKADSSTVSATKKGKELSVSADREKKPKASKPKMPKEAKK